MRLASLPSFSLTSIRSRLSVTIWLASMVFFLGISYYLGDRVALQVTENKGALFSEVARSLILQLDKDMHSRLTEIGYFSNQSRIRSADFTPSQKREPLNDLIKRQPTYAWVGMTDAQGRIVVGTNGLLEGINVADRAYFVDGQHGPFVGDVHGAILLAKKLPAPKHDPLPLRLVDVAHPVYDLKTNRFTGVLVAHLSWDWATEVRNELLRPLGEMPGLEVVVFDKAGKPLMAPADVLLGQRQALAPDAQVLHDGGKKHFITGAANETYLASYAQSTGYEDYAGLGWSVVVRQKTTQALAEADHIRRTLRTVGILVSLLFGWLIWSLAGRLTKPLRTIAAVANRISEGNYDAAIPLIDGQGEAADLAKALNAMKAALDAKRQALAEANAALENRVRERTAQLQHAQQIAKIGSWRWDIASGNLEWSDEIFRIFGVEPQAFKPTYEVFLSQIHPQDRDAVDAAVKHSLHTKSDYAIEHRICLPNGDIHHVQELGALELDADGTPIAMIGTVQDITERKLLEQAAQEHAQQTQAILDNVVDGIITIDTSGKVLSMNRAAESMFEYQADEVRGGSFSMLLPQSYRNLYEAHLKNYSETGVPRLSSGASQEIEGLRKSGGTFPVDLAISRSVHRGQPIIIGLVRDITERRKVDQLKTEFVSTVSHELRTPLTSINGALGLVCAGTLGAMPPQAQSMLDIAYKNSQRLTHLINDLLDMEKIVAGKMEFDLQSQDIMPLVDQSIERNEAYALGYQMRLRLTQRADGVQVRVDGSRLEQVMSNFLSNAAKFSPAGGQVEIAVHAAPGLVRVEVIDHGPGIPDEFKDRVFQKFSQADASDTRQRSGTGLGLAISKELIERMNGKIGFQSVPGQGATFYFELPT